VSDDRMSWGGRNLSCAVSYYVKGFVVRNPLGDLNLLEGISVMGAAIGSICCLALVLLAGFAEPAELAPVLVTCVDDNATGYATFQSHNQRVVSNEHGIFLAYILSRNEAYTAQEWRLMQSTDNGTSFSLVYGGVHATNPPVLETDSKNNLYLIHPDFISGDAYLYRFSSTEDYANPAITTLPGGAAGKYAMAIDETRNRLYFMAHNGRFFRLDLDGALLYEALVLKDGPHAALQYPSLCVDATGRLFLGWTTVKHNEYLYWDIHALVSKDQGQAWRRIGGDVVDLPAVADDTGPAPRISLEDETNFHTWLANMAVHAGKLHFLYLVQTQPVRQHYVRYDLATGQEDVRIQPDFKGETLAIKSLDGFFSHAAADGPIYCVGSHEGRVVCLVSRDNGVTWHDHAISSETFNVYALGGCRRLTKSGEIIGIFTDTASDTSEGNAKVYFFRIPGRT
jgi:hypothetical protein